MPSSAEAGSKEGGGLSEAVSPKSNEIGARSDCAGRGAEGAGGGFGRLWLPRCTSGPPALDRDEVEHIRKFVEAADLQVRDGVTAAARALAWAAFVAVDPRRLKTQCLRRLDVVPPALGHVEDPLGRQLEHREGEAEMSRVWLVRAARLR